MYNALVLEYSSTYPSTRVLVLAAAVVAMRSGGGGGSSSSGLGTARLVEVPLSGLTAPIQIDLNNDREQLERAIDRANG